MRRRLRYVMQAHRFALSAPGKPLTVRTTVAQREALEDLARAHHVTVATAARHALSLGLQQLTSTVQG